MDTPLIAENENDGWIWKAQWETCRVNERLFIVSVQISGGDLSMDELKGSLQVYADLQARFGRLVKPFPIGQNLAPGHLFG